MNVTRATFDEVMVPNYNPANMYRYVVKVPAFGIRMVLNTSISQVVLP